MLLAAEISLCPPAAAVLEMKWHRVLFRLGEEKLLCSQLNLAGVLDRHQGAQLLAIGFDVLQNVAFFDCVAKSSVGKAAIGIHIRLQMFLVDVFSQAITHT